MKRNLKPIVLVLSSLMASGSMFAASTYVDLQALFDTDVFLGSGGTGLGNALDANGRRIDPATLPASYVDGSPAATQDGRASFKFGVLSTASLDGAAINGQSLSVKAGQYGSVDLALLAAPQAFGDPFSAIEFHYADGSKDTNRFGPVAGWFDSPNGYDHAILTAVDNSQVSNIVSFPTDFSAAEAPYLAQQNGTAQSGSARFCDARAYALYEIDNLAGLTQATLGITVGNDFVISLATDYYDPDVSTTDGYTVLANSETLYGFEERNLANLKEYLFDVSSELAEGTGTLYILFTDATPANGWGPYIQQIRLFTGTARYYSQRLDPAVDTSGATVNAMFDTGTDAETPYLYDNSASGPSNRGHRFADGSQSLTYKFDFPSNTANAKLTVDMANNFVVSLRGGQSQVQYASVVTGTSGETNYLVDAGGSNINGYRYADGNAYMIYQFDLPDDVTNAVALIQVGNEFVIQAASGTNGDFQTEWDWVAQTGQETHDLSNLNYYDVDLTKYLTNNPSKIVQIRFSDGVPTDGWGPYVEKIMIVNTTNTGFQEVLNSQALFGADVHSEYNKGYYTIDLSPVLIKNPAKEVFVQFTDGSTGDGWGPGVFWMAAYSGNIDIQSDRLVFNGLKSTLGDPTNYSLDLLQRRCPLNSSKTLSSIVLPAADTNNPVYLLAATLNAVEAPPALGILLQPGATVRLSWPTNAADYVLQSTANLVSPQWMTVTASSAVVGGQITVTQAVAGTRFYRLAK
ncbi:MAG: hypothetical protein ABSH34_27290 [Verrucomicrobiota bacterium]|jgi:hypothetical protein